MPILDREIETNGTEYKIETKKLTPEEKKQEEMQTPKYMTTLKLSDDQKKRLLDEVKKEFEAIKKEREEKKLDKKFKTLQNQYEGVVREDELRQFNLHKHVTKIKCDAVERLIMKAAWKSDPKFSISARPEFDRQGGREVTEAQEDFLDYKMDEDIPFYEPERKTVHSAIVKGVGILKIFHEIKREKRRREEYYKGNPKPVIDPQTGQPAIGPDKKPLIMNEGLNEFVQNYPDAPTKYPSYVNKLAEGKEIHIVVEYEETTYNDPLPENIPVEDFYVRTGTKGYEGLKTTRLTVERQTYTWWELKAKEKRKKFYDIDELMYKEQPKADKSKREAKPGYENEKYSILECVYYFKLNEKDEEETKITVWMAEEKWIVVGSIYYPYYAIGSYYIPHYISVIWDGFYQPSLAEYLTMNNLAENALLNFTLEGAMTANTITPIAEESSPVHSQFLEKRWAHGVPIETADGKPLDFLNKYIGGFNHVALVTLLEMLGRDDGDISGVSQLVTGRESMLDPTAPAAKTLALLQQSGINVEDYIDAMVPSFNRIADVILQLYYQMSEEGRKYRVKPERIVGGNPFKTLSRADMIARTNIQSRAKAFNFDEVNEKVEDLALFNTIRMEPLIARNPQAVYKLLKSIIKGWSKKWRNLVDEILPPLEQFQQQQQVLVAQGVAQYVDAKIKEAEMLKQPAPKILIDELMTVVSDLISESTTPPAPEVVKEREKEAKSGQKPV